MIFKWHNTVGYTDIIIEAGEELAAIVLTQNVGRHGQIQYLVIH